MCGLCERYYDTIANSGELGRCEESSDSICENYIILEGKRIALVGEPLYGCMYPIEKNTDCF